PAGAAEQWSSADYTEAWSKPTYTEQWSVEPEKPDAQAPAALPQTEPSGWIDPSALEGPPTAPSVYIKLQIDSRRAVIGGEERALDAAPTVKGGRTMVPFRFLGEALQASVQWDPAAQRITLSLGDESIVLTVDQTTALVNGRTVTMDAPPVISEGRTLVPLRFVAENLKLGVTHTAATNTIEIQSGPGASGGSPAASPIASEATAALDREPIADFEQLYGTWRLWTPGGATNLYYKDTGDYATHEYNAGADQGTVTIRADGTYAMDHALWGKAEGEWRLSFPGEINGERIQAIVLPDGASGYVWAVAPGDNGKIRLLSSWGAWADGSSSWLFENELYKD
ncbi:MAG TPA: copper amine oxidase N-terminal domain-containing protein, partial [Paenibacillus sp.]|nr:copper amine oxidase N-terminal domain-containing protein [Paenibacillus sp.]